LDKKTKSLVQGYLEKANAKLKVAETLLENKSFDDAVSRAYYCAFHATQALLLTEGLSANTHQGVVNLFGLHFVKTNKFDSRFGKHLSNLKDDRETSDYEIYSPIDKTTAETAVSEAIEFLAAAENYLAKLIRK